MARLYTALCIYCAVDQRTSAVAKVIAQLREREAMDYSLVVVATGEDAPGLRYITPYAAMSIGEYFRDRGQDALVVIEERTEQESEEEEEPTQAEQSEEDKEEESKQQEEDQEKEESDNQ